MVIQVGNLRRGLASWLVFVDAAPINHRMAISDPLVQHRCEYLDALASEGPACFLLSRAAQTAICTAIVVLPLPPF
jgi:hypothetical protein